MKVTWNLYSEQVGRLRNLRIISGLPGFFFVMCLFCLLVVVAVAVVAAAVVVNVIVSILLNV